MKFLIVAVILFVLTTGQVQAAKPLASITLNETNPHVGQYVSFTVETTGRDKVPYIINICRVGEQSIWEIGYTNSVFGIGAFDWATSGVSPLCTASLFDGGRGFSLSGQIDYSHSVLLASTSYQVLP